jgi:plasmid stabilization system protein ParE
MTYDVVIQPPAKLDIDAAYQFIFSRSEQSANKWFVGLFKSIESLSKIPSRCGLARESGEFSEPIRQLLYGRRPHLYRVIFIVRNREVRVLRVLHGARATAKPEELQQ